MHCQSRRHRQEGARDWLVCEVHGEAGLQGARLGAQAVFEGPTIARSQTPLRVSHCPHLGRHPYPGRTRSGASSYSADVVMSSRFSHPPTSWWSNEPVRGFRMWRIDNGRMVGNHGGFWVTRRMTARCKKSPGRSEDLPVPHDEQVCEWPGCGVYAMKKPDLIIQGLIDELTAPHHPMTAAGGVVEMTGRVIEHEHGYRAEHAEAVALCTLTRRGDTLALALHQHPGSIATAFVDPPSSESNSNALVFQIEIGLRHMAAFLQGFDRSSVPEQHGGVTQLRLGLPDRRL